MRPRRWMRPICVILVIALSFWASCVLAAARSRIAVVDLESQGEKAKSEELGKVAAQWLATAFVNQGRFDVIERQALEELIQEQQLGSSGLIDVNTAAQLGRVLGATYIVTGAVISHRQGIDLNVKIIETESATIKVADRLAANSVGSMSNKIGPFVAQLVSKFPLRGFIIHQKGETFILDVGKSVGAKAGMKFQVYREGEIIKHPVSGEILGIEKIATGMLQVTEVQEKLAFARVIEQKTNESVAVGQNVVSVGAIKPGPSGPIIGVPYSTSASTVLRFSVAWGRQGDGSGDFLKPFGVAADASGNIYVADTYNNRIQVFDNSGTFMKAWGQKGSGPGSLALPWDVAVDGEGNVYVADTYNYRIEKFDLNGVYQGQWGQKGRGSGDFAFLSGISVGPDGNIYTVDAKLNRVQVFDSQGRFLRSWGSKGKGSASFVSPFGLTVDGSGNVYVADSKMRRVQKFDSQGRFLAAFTDRLTYPVDIAIDQSSGNLLILDAASHLIWEMSPTGQNLRSYGGPGKSSGQFVEPYGLCADGASNVFVADTGNCRVQKFSH
ncbi:MAG: 6-bladed beta-propeller [Deltaproteobacteria bacterium]|nr:6-bladed beta-propeller [Deltaproteobacteria bacterium]